ncbi:MAG: glycosyltransferase [Sphingomonas sp.]|nr:glycosyltransferase [Sphingomonas sp.]
MARPLAFLLPDLGCGGAERLTLDLAGAAVARGGAAEIVALRAEGELISALPAGVGLVDLGAPRIRHGLVPLRRYLRRARPAGLIATMWPLPVLALLAAAGRGVPVIAAEHGPPLAQYAGQRLRLLSLRASMWASYRHAAAVVAVSRGLAGEIATLAGLAPERVATVYNPVPPPRLSDVEPEAVRAWRARGGVKLLNIGTLKPQKDQRLLIEMLALLVSRGVDARLAIVGEGAERAALAARAAALGLADRVSLPGFTATPGDWYRAADAFVLSSNHEGAPLVLIEALHFGLPVISTDCRFGPAELLGDGRWGRLVPPGDAGALADAVVEALAAPRDPAALRARAAEFSVDRALDGYLRLIGV